MEKLIKKTLSFPFKSFAQFFVTFGTLLVLAACGNKDDSNNNYLGINGCLNCQGITSPLAIATFDSESLYMANWPVQMTGMQLFVNGINYTPGVSSAYNLYTGYVAVQGNLMVTGGVALTDQMGACVISPGVYALQTLNMGTIQQGANLIVPDMQAGPIRLRMSQASYIGGSMLVNEGGAIRWKGRLEIVSVNGQPCNNFYSDMR